MTTPMAARSNIQPLQDEIFHVPQTNLYCRGNFSYWDPMITTLPGTYVVAAGALKMAAAVTAQAVGHGHTDADLWCSTTFLRATNIAYSCGTMFVVWGLLRKLHLPRDSVGVSVQHGNLCPSLLALTPDPSHKGVKLL
eukprot:m.141451 g.141451  ORF g.141451 m.141451 type:complete len:138 (-) comp17115_c0_seq6:75-488(-)